MTLLTQPPTKQSAKEPTTNTTMSITPKPFSVPQSKLQPKKQKTI